jgi:tetrahydromethanopterin S-methyltransferase subunit B
MADHDLLIVLNQKVDTLIATMDAHIKSEAETDRAILYPMWNAYQQSKGAAKLAGAMCAIVGGIIVGIIDYFCRKVGI